MRFFGRNLVILLLIAVMEMPVVSPPALRHSHPDGDTSHRYDVATVKLHGHSHAHGPRHSHSSGQGHRTEAAKAKHSHDDRASHSAQSPVEHYHVFWFGFEFSMPLPAPEHSDSPRTMANVEQWVPLISEIILPDAATDGSSVRIADLAMPTGLTPRLPARPLQKSATAWLCDTARHERSGVLVI